MDKEEYFKKIIIEFENWWLGDKHSSYMDFYKDTITASYLKSLSDNDFVDFFYEFVRLGGRVQSGGERTKNKFRKTIKKDLNNFKKFVLNPFQSKFSDKEWFLQLDNYPGFGVGIATIFLNRIDNTKYPIMNNKTLKGLNKIGFKISSSKNWANYELIKKYQDILINKFPLLKNYFKADALNHFIISVYKGQEIISDYLQFEVFENNLEQHEIEGLLKTDLNKYDKKDLYNKIIDCENDKSEKIIINGKTYKRHNYLMAQIKKYRDFKCQFCATKILKANGNYYIEACHIKPKAEGGKDILKNILILCPNCHKLFDFGKRKKEKYLKDTYSLSINGKTYKASLK